MVKPLLACITFVSGTSIRNAFIENLLVFEYKQKENVFDSVFDKVLHKNKRALSIDQLPKRML